MQPQFIAKKYNSIDKGDLTERNAERKKSYIPFIIFYTILSWSTPAYGKFTVLSDYKSLENINTKSRTDE